MGIGLVIELAKSRNPLIGSTREVVSIIPNLKDINIIRTFSGLRSYITGKLVKQIYIGR